MKNKKIKINLDIDITAILFWGRSGSFFVGTLLDNHKNILTIPGAYLSNFYGIDGFWHRMMQKQYSLNEIIDNFCLENIGMFDGKQDKGANLACLGDNKNICLKVSIEEFKFNLLKISKSYNLLKRKNFFIAVHYVYEMCLGHDVSKKRLINYQLHTPVEVRISDFQQDFPNAKYLGTYREPVRALYSHIRHHKDNQIEKGKEYYEYSAVYDGVYLWYYQHQLVGWKDVAVKLNLNLLPIRLEDLHDKPKKTVKKIAKFLDIKFKKTLMESTFCGLTYWGDPRAVQMINGFSSSHTRKSSYQECFTKHDVIVLNQLVALKHDEYKYLLEDNEYLQILEYMITVPTKIEKEALDKSTTFEEYKSALIAYKQRVAFSIEFLNSKKENWKLKCRN